MGGNFLGKGRAVESIPGRGVAPPGATAGGSAAHADLHDMMEHGPRGGEGPGCRSGPEGPPGCKEFYARTIDSYYRASAMSRCGCFCFFFNHS